jgi:hypothetical protein
MSFTFFIPGAQERATAAVRNAELAMGLMGAAVGLALGLAGGLARKRSRAGAAAAGVGLVLGAAAGAGAALAAVPLADRVQAHDPGNLYLELSASLLVHGLPWAAIGAMGGLAFGVGLGGLDRILRGLLGGLLGAAAGALLYEVIGALALPGAKLIEPIAASWGIRLLAQFVAVISLSAGIAALVPDSPHEKS